MPDCAVAAVQQAQLRATQPQCSTSMLNCQCSSCTAVLCSEPTQAILCLQTQMRDATLEKQQNQNLQETEKHMQFAAQKRTLIVDLQRMTGARQLNEQSLSRAQWHSHMHNAQCSNSYWYNALPLKTRPHAAITNAAGPHASAAALRCHVSGTCAVAPAGDECCCTQSSS